MSDAATVRLELSRAAEWDLQVVTIPELREVLRRLRTLLDAARPLVTRDLSLPEADAAASADDPELAKRARSAAPDRDHVGVRDRPRDLPREFVARNGGHRRTDGTGYSVPVISHYRRPPRR